MRCTGPACRAADARPCIRAYIARAIAAANPEQELHHTYGRVRRLAEIVRLPAVQLAVTAMIFGQGVMTMVMGVTSLHMSHHNHGLGDISLVFGAHTLGHTVLTHEPPSSLVGIMRLRVRRQ